MPKDYSKKAAKWQQKLSGAGQDYIDGVNGVTDSPMSKAAARVDTAIARYTESLRSGQWAASLNAVNIADWKKQCVGVGASRLQDGATKGMPKTQKFWAKAGARLNAIRDEVRAMPNATRADRRARANRAMDLMEQMKGIMST